MTVAWPFQTEAQRLLARDHDYYDYYSYTCSDVVLS